MALPIDKDLCSMTVTYSTITQYFAQLANIGFIELFSKHSAIMHILVSQVSLMFEI